MFPVAGARRWLWNTVRTGCAWDTVRSPAGGCRRWTGACDWHSLPAGLAREFSTFNMLPKECKPVKTSWALSQARSWWFLYAVRLGTPPPPSPWHWWRVSSQSHLSCLCRSDGICQVSVGTFLYLVYGVPVIIKYPGFSARGWKWPAADRGYYSKFLFKMLLGSHQSFGYCFLSCLVFFCLFVCGKVLSKYYMLIEESVANSIKYKKPKKK